MSDRPWRAPLCSSCWLSSPLPRPLTVGSQPSFARLVAVNRHRDHFKVGWPAMHGRAVFVNPSGHIEFLEASFLSQRNNSSLRACDKCDQLSCGRLWTRGSLATLCFPTFSGGCAAVSKVGCRN